MSGILAYATYVPYWKLKRAEIGGFLGTAAGQGTRSVASYDEDATSMGVEAARAALARTPAGAGARQLFFATTRPGYLDKTNATVIHAAVGLDQDTFVVDMLGAVRSGIGALRTALASSEPTLAVLSDVRTGNPGGADESDGGDAAAALLCAADGDFVAEYLGGSSITAEFLDRWRVPGESASRVWEERFGEHAYVPLVEAAFAAGLKDSGLTADDIDHLVLAGTHGRALRAVAKTLGVRAESVTESLFTTIGNTGVAHAGVLLADVLDRAEPGQTIAVVALADGADVLVFRTTELLRQGRQPVPLSLQAASAREDLSYAKYLTWRGTLRLEPPRRPDPDAPAAPPSYRSEGWKFGFTGSVCGCGTVHLPPARVCMSCGRVDEMTAKVMRDVQATIATFTIDRLAYSESPPVVVAVIDFDGGGRFQCQLTDVDADEVAIGDRVEMTFRKVNTVNGVHNYFWKARPVRGNR